jgi:hypothetical protein
MKLFAVMIQKIQAEKILAGLSENDPFRSAYENTIVEMQRWIDFYEKHEI